MSTIAQLTEDLAKEVDEHALSENELRKLENRVESLTEQLRDALDCKEEIEHKNKTLREKLVDAEQEIKNSHRLTQSQHKELLRYEFKQAELATLDTAVLKVKVKDLENSIAGKERIIDLLKKQEKLSLKEIAQLRQYHSDCAPLDSSLTTKPEGFSSSLDTPELSSRQPDSLAEPEINMT